MKWAWSQHPAKKHMLNLLMPSVMSSLPASAKPAGRAGRLCLKAHFFFCHPPSLFSQTDQSSDTRAWLLCKTWALRDKHPRHGQPGEHLAAPSWGRVWASPALSEPSHCSQSPAESLQPLRTLLQEHLALRCKHGKPPGLSGSCQRAICSRGKGFLFAPDPCARRWH